jgi:hypothetical protein
LALVGIETKASMPHIPTRDIIIVIGTTQLQIAQFFVPFLQQCHLQLGQQHIHDYEK